MVNIPPPVWSLVYVVIAAGITGHDTLYAWRCAGGKAEAGAPVGALHARGFLAEYWRLVK